ncbi:hypothetical protein B484DRAFT_394187, partial [Ochromonadaceae sp. CCMP2298]
MGVGAATANVLADLLSPGIGTLFPDSLHQSLSQSALGSWAAALGNSANAPPVPPSPLFTVDIGMGLGMGALGVGNGAVLSGVNAWLADQLSPYIASEEGEMGGEQGQGVGIGQGQGGQGGQGQGIGQGLAGVGGTGSGMGSSHGSSGSDGSGGGSNSSGARGGSGGGGDVVKYSTPMKANRVTAPNKGNNSSTGLEMLFCALESDAQNSRVRGEMGMGAGAGYGAGGSRRLRLRDWAVQLNALCTCVCCLGRELHLVEQQYRQHLQHEARQMALFVYATQLEPLLPPLYAKYDITGQQMEERSAHNVLQGVLRACLGPTPAEVQQWEQ